MNRVKFTLAAASVSLAMTLTFSCAGNDADEEVQNAPTLYGETPSSSEATQLSSSEAVSSSSSAATELSSSSIASYAGDGDCGGKAYSLNTHYCYGGAIYAKCSEGSIGDGGGAAGDGKFCFGNGAMGIAVPRCAGNPQEYDPFFYECREGKNGVFLKKDLHYEGEVYEAVLIGKQVWMARNLNYAAPDSKCYEGMENFSYMEITAEESCAIYGRLYDWETAVAGSEPSHRNPSGVQGVCPEGWHLPSYPEWGDMASFVATNIRINPNNNTAAKLRTSTLWVTGTGGKPVGTDEVGFSALPGGAAGATNLAGTASTGYDMGISGYWWTSGTAYLGGTARGYSIKLETAGNFEHNRNAYFSIRCVKNL